MDITEDATTEGIPPETASSTNRSKDVGSADEETAVRMAIGKYAPSTQGAYFLEETETERLMTGAEFTELYQKEIAKHRTKADGTRVSFGEKLFGTPQQRNTACQKATSRRKPAKNAFSVLSTPVKQAIHRRTHSAPRSTSHHAVGLAAAASGAMSERKDGVTSSRMEGPGFLLESYVTHFDAKFRRRQIPRSLPDAEALYVELIALKQKVADVEGENLALRTVVRKKEKEKLHVEKRVEELIANGAVLDNNALRSERAVAEGHLIQNLRNKIRVLETNLTLITEELHRLKLDGKYLRVRELETEVKAYYSEARRLQRILEQMTAVRNKDSEKQAMDEALSLLQDKEQIIVRLRETIAGLKQTVKQNRQELDRLLEEKERQRQESQRKIEDLSGEGGEYRQQAKAYQEEAQELRTKLEDFAQIIAEKEEQASLQAEQLQRVKQDLEKLAKEHEDLVREHKQLISRNMELQGDTKELHIELEALQEKYSAEQLAHTELNQQLRQSLSKADYCQEQCQRMRDDYEALVAERDLLLKQNRQSQDESQLLKDQVKDLAAELLEEQESHRRTQRRVGNTKDDYKEEVTKLKDDYEAEMDELHRKHKAAISEKTLALEEERHKCADAQREALHYQQQVAELTEQLSRQRERLRSTMDGLATSVDHQPKFAVPLPSDTSASGEDSDARPSKALALQGADRARQMKSDPGVDSSDNNNDQLQLPKGIAEDGAISPQSSSHDSQGSGRRTRREADTKSIPKAHSSSDPTISTRPQADSQHSSDEDHIQRSPETSPRAPEDQDQEYSSDSAEE